MHSGETGWNMPYEEDNSAGNHNGKCSTDKNQHENKINESKTRNQSLVIFIYPQWTWHQMVFLSI